MTTFYLIRHGETDYSRNNTMIFTGLGQSFSPLTSNGIQQIKNTSKYTRLSNSNLIISSPYTRALQSASIISKELQIDLIVEPTLFEWINKKDFSDFNSEDDVSLKEYNEYNGVYPEGEIKEWEDNELLRNRILEVMERYLDYENVIIVCHGILIHSLFPDKWLNNGEIINYNFNYDPAERHAVYNSDGEKTCRTIVQDDRLEENEHRMFVHIVIANHEGKFLMQKRSIKKRFFPGVWDTTGGGVKYYEETIDAAIRETREETGLSFTKDQIQFVSRIFDDHFLEIFFARKEFNIEDCIMDEVEVDELKLFEPDDMFTLFSKKEDVPTNEYMETLKHIVSDLL